ncbi:MAG: hypothetical protein INR69_11370 [Mucilaginibacter polytrichastri]|nr:hypothetical protein [Mucilaginibacter polytrichastri]
MMENRTATENDPKFMALYKDWATKVSELKEYALHTNEFPIKLKEVRAARKAMDAYKKSVK